MYTHIYIYIYLYIYIYMYIYIYVYMYTTEGLTLDGALGSGGERAGCQTSRHPRTPPRQPRRAQAALQVHIERQIDR